MTHSQQLSVNSYTSLLEPFKEYSSLQPSTEAVDGGKTVETVSCGNTLTYETMLETADSLTYPDYLPIKNATLAISNKIERIFKLQKLIDTSKNKDILTAAALVLEKVIDGRL